MPVPDFAAAIEAVMRAHPELTHFGFGVFDPDRKTSAQVREEMLTNRARMLESRSIEEFRCAVDFLAQVPRRKTLNRGTTSYGLKHEAEHFHRERGAAEYISNGMFIAAAIHLGFMVQRIGPNAWLNVASGTKRVKALNCPTLLAG